jgi:hypothetical protein
MPVAPDDPKNPKESKNYLIFCSKPLGGKVGLPGYEVSGYQESVSNP